MKLKKKICTAIIVMLSVCLCACQKGTKEEKRLATQAALRVTQFDWGYVSRPLFVITGDGKNPITVTVYAKAMVKAAMDRKNFIEYDIHLMAVGDDLMHEGVINSGLQADNTYNYESLFAGIQPYLDFADIKVINQETIMAGNEKGFSGYPTFNSPTEMADSIANVGFNVVTHATNHTDDKGIDGINYCKNYWDENHPDIMVVGMYGEEGKNDDIPIMEIDGVTFAMLNYTYGCNWASLQPNLEDHVELLTTYNPSDRMIDFNALNPDVLDDIERAEQMADFVVVFPHWGIEYQTVENAYQDSVAAQMIDAGADIIIGTHPHVCQPVKWITTDNGNTGLCYFSLGNFLSSQYDAPTFIEGMAWVTIHVTSTGAEIVPDETGVLPMVLHYVSPGNKIIQTYAIEDYTEELALNHACVARSGVTLHLSYLQDKSQEIFGDMILSVDTIMNGANNTFSAVGATQIYNPSNSSGNAVSVNPTEQVTDVDDNVNQDDGNDGKITESDDADAAVSQPVDTSSRPRYNEDGVEILYLDEYYY